MPKLSKRKEYFSSLEEKKYNVDEAVEFLSGAPKTSFTESLDVSINLGIDPVKSDQNVRGATSLPSGTGKSCKVAVFAEGDEGKAAKDAGADAVGMDDLAEEFKKGADEYDVVIATPETMKIVSPLGKVLGPKGLMPNPKTGTVTMEVGKAVSDVKKGKIDFKVDKFGIIHVALAKSSFTPQKITENINEFLRTVSKLKPSSAKGNYFKSIYISTTMSPSVQIDNKIFN